MDSSVNVSQKDLNEFLLQVSPHRSVFIWGQPGIGKSSLVRQFADSLGLECVTLLGTQLAPEDLIGVPQIVDGKSRFCPPSLIAQDKPYCLFLDELNGSSPEVQKAFYSLILDRRLGDFELHPDSIVIGAGNRSQDSAVVRPMSSALVNRLVHVHLEPSVQNWLEWASANGIHKWITDYIRQRPDHLYSAPPKHEEPFTTPRSWHMLSDSITSFKEDRIDDEWLMILAHGCLSPEHAGQFRGFVKQVRHAYSLDAIIKGDMRWPDAPTDRDVLYFLAQSFRVKLLKELPKSKAGAPKSRTDLGFRAKGLIAELAEISLEIAQLVVSEEDDDKSALPAWFLTEVVRDLPRLVKS